MRKKKSETLDSGFVLSEMIPAARRVHVKVRASLYFQAKRASSFVHSLCHCVNIPKTSTFATVFAFPETIICVSAAKRSSGDDGFTTDRKSVLSILVVSKNRISKSRVSWLIPRIWSLQPSSATNSARPLPNKNNVSCENVSLGGCISHRGSAKSSWRLDSKRPRGQGP